jgi:hypothetical protein
MRTVLWAFIWAVTLFDAGFAYFNGRSFQEWELNPIAVRLGLHGAIFLRVAGACFAGAVGHRVKSKLFPSTIAGINAVGTVLYLG